MNTEFLLDYSTILANQARPVHLAIRFKADGVPNPRPRPAAFCVVLDRSGSMGGAPLDHAKQAAKVAVRNLRPDDQFALVIFDNTARTVIPLQSARNKQAFYDAIDQVQSGGSTNLTGGWMLGRDELRKAATGTTRRLLLLSDGHLNHGIVEPPEVRQIVVAGLEQDVVRTSCLGFGDNYNEDLMAELARATNGQFYDADSPETFPAIFASELDGLQRLAVQNLRVRAQSLDFCEAYTLLGEYPALALPDGRMEFAIGDLVGEEQRIVCFGVQALALPLINGKPPFDLQGEPLLGFEVLWDELLEQGIVSRTLTQQVRIQATQDPAAVVVNGVVAPWVSMQKAGKVAAEVTQQMDRGQAAEALAALDKAILELSPYGAQAAEGLKLLHDLKEKIAGGEWSMRERKNARYSSSSLRKMSSHEKWSHGTPPPSFKDPPKDAGAKPPTP
jgi:Ca-activated chloride channel family protein